MNLEVEAYAGELRALRRINEIVRHEVLAEKLGDVFFICGVSGQYDNNNLPEKIHVCPAYGLDWFQIYERTDVTVGPEW